MRIPPEWIVLIVAFVAIVGSMTIAILSLWTGHKRKRQVLHNIHLERMAAIEKGITLPPSKLEELIGNRNGPAIEKDPMRRGLTLTLVGIAIGVALYYTDSEAWVWGLPVLAVGLSNLIYVVVSHKLSAGQ